MNKSSEFCRKKVVVIIKIIETNLSVDNAETIKDHQSRIVEANSWEDYCRTFREYNGEPVEFNSLTKMNGRSIPKLVDISNLVYDEIHLSCDIWNGKFKTKKLAYIIFE